MANNNNDLISDIDSISVSSSYCCTPENCTQVLNSDCRRTLKVIHMNIRSINKNFSDFEILLTRIKIDYDIILLSECWLNGAHSLPTLMGYTSFSSKMTINQNDGIVLYVKSNIDCSVTEPYFDGFNCLVCKVNSDIVLVGIYRSPSSRHIDCFLNSLDSILNSLKSYKNVIVAGDLNIDIKTGNNSRQSNEYLTLAASHCLLPAHSFPTRLDNCLDHFLLKTVYKAITIVIETNITDHYPVMLCLNLSKTTLLKPSTTRTFVDVLEIDKIIKNTDFSQVLTCRNANEACNTFVSILLPIIRSQTIIKNIPSRNRILKPWITEGLLRCIRNRDRMHYTLRKAPENAILKITYIRYRNFCNDLLRKLKVAYEKSEFSKAQNNPKATWDTIRKVTNTQKEKTSSQELLKIRDSPKQSVNYINSFFAGIGKDLANKIISNHNTEKQNFELHKTISVPNSLVILEVTETEVERILLNLRSHCAVGWDSISPQMLKASRSTLVPIITHICNLSIITGVFPSALKKALVTPIYKNGDRDKITNYRPISVLPTLSKILERILNNNLINFLESHNIIANNQFGFRAGISTDDALIALTNSVVKQVDSKRKCIGIFLDLTKAFDSVSVPILISKLEEVGVRGTMLNIFRDYLTDRKQCVKIGDYISDEQCLQYGVPQGSILGPTLFQIYVNHLCQLKINKCEIFVYADDTALIISGKDWSEANLIAKDSLKIVMNWLHCNLLTLNIEKTKFITFGNRISLCPPPTYDLKIHTCSTGSTINNCFCLSLSRSTEIKYLGVEIDCRLSWQAHIKKLTSSIRKIIYIFKKLRLSADSDILKLVYLALCQSLLSYCVTAWGGASKTAFLELERAQRAVLKVMTRKPFRYPTNDLYNECKVLTVRQLYILRTILKKHNSLTYDAVWAKKNRTLKPVCNIAPHNTATAGHQYTVMSSRIYNKVNKINNIYPLCTREVKQKITKWLQTLSYTDTENLLLRMI